jgi:flagellin-like protein
MNVEKIGDRGVSPVIAVILMVAITVILASVVGAFVLDVGSKLSEGPPAATFEAEQQEYENVKDGGGPLEIDGGSLTGVRLIYTGGESITSENINVTVNGETAIATDQADGLDTNLHPNALLPFSGAGEVGISTSFVVLGSASESDITELNSWNTDEGPNPNIMEVTQSGGTFLEEASGGNGKLHKVSQGDTIRITYESNKGTSHILFTYEVK